MKRTLIIACLLLAGLAVIPAQADHWNEFRARYAVVLYKDVPLDFVKTVAESADADYRDIAAGLGFGKEETRDLKHRIQIYIYANEQEYARQARPYEWSSGEASTRERIIRTFPAAHGFFDSTLPHELGHIIFREQIGSGAVIPLWFEEGVAMYQEKAKRFGADAAVLNSLKNGQFISLTDLANMRLYNDSSPEHVQTFYAESASLVKYLVGEMGSFRFMTLCRELKNGKTFLDSLESAYARFSSYENLNKAWIGYLQAQQ